MAYTLSNLRTDIRDYTEVSDTVLTDALLANIIKNTENQILRAIPTDQNAHYATSTLIVGNRYVTIPQDLRSINYFYFKSADSATLHGVKGGEENCSAGPVTLEGI